MSIQLRDKQHFYPHKYIRDGVKVSQKKYAGNNWLPCNSATCVRQRCRDGFIYCEFEPALRMKARNSNLRMLTVSKMTTEALNQFARELVDGLRERGHSVESIAALEPHQQGLYHIHQHLDTDADNATIQEVASRVLGQTVNVRTGEMTADSMATKWTEIAITPVHPGGAAYPFKNLRKKLGLPHLDLNGGRAYSFMTRGFFTSVGGKATAAKSERELNRTYREHLEPLLGRYASKVSDKMKSATQMVKLCRDLLFLKLMTTKETLNHFPGLGIDATTTELREDALGALQSFGNVQQQVNPRIIV